MDQNCCHCLHVYRMPERVDDMFLQDPGMAMLLLRAEKGYVRVMEFENFFEPEVGVAAVVVAAVFSPRARKALRKGLVYTTAGVLMAGDAIVSAAKNLQAGRGDEHTTAAPTTGQEAGRA